MVLGVAILGIGAYGTYKGAMTLTWPRATATITSAELLRRVMPAARRDGRSGEESWNSFDVLYRYHVGDLDYVAGGVEPYDFGMQNSAGAARMRERHPVGSSAEVAYDPRDPATAYLEPGPSSFALALVGIGSAIALAGLWVRRKAAKGIGTMNQRGATEDVGDAIKDGDRM
ncbi:MAG: DUF3592 domain-containing protein [Proteobacteria bacterium]|nr:DUF3592 domain-containing protein [Pseudomonadota bacterium]